MVKQMIDEYHGDHNQVHHLVLLLKHIDSQEIVSNIASKTIHTINLDSAQNTISLPCREDALIELNNLVHHCLRQAIADTYGNFCSPNSLMLPNKEVI